MKPTVLLASTLTILLACNPPKSDSTSDGALLSLAVANGLDMAVEDAMVEVDLESQSSEVRTQLASGPLTAAVNGSEEEGVQCNDFDRDGMCDELVMVLSIPGGSSRQVDISRGQGTAPKRTYAEISIKEGGKWNDRVYEGGTFRNVTELSVPPEHTDHSFYIRYEGPGWESDKVGYRFYLDWRNATDIFGKKTNDLVLDRVGLDGFDSYHEMADWGMDILKVGDALGIGSLGCWSEGKVMRMSQTDSVACSIPVNGPVQSSVQTHYWGWVTPDGKTDVVSTYSIAAGSRMTTHIVELSRPIEDLCTGIVKHPDAEVLTDDSDLDWGYLATWGKQSLAGDMLGMALFYEKALVSAREEDQHNHAIVFDSGNRTALEYGFAACWEKEPGGIQTKEEFETYLRETVERLSTPVVAEVVQ